MLKLVSMNALGLLVLRLGLAILVLSQGFEKITRAGTKWGAAWHYTGPPPPPALFGGPNPPPPSKHLPAPVQLVISWGQVFCGMALLLGVLTRWAAAVLFVLQVGAIGIFTIQDRFSFPEGGGYQYNSAILVMCVALMFLGGGALSLEGRSEKSEIKREQSDATDLIPHL
jgi:putative oxidoreductase